FLNTSWNGWLRDIVPQDIMGKFFSQRLRVATIAAAVSAMAAAFFIDWWKSYAGGPGGVPVDAELVKGYSYAILFGSLLLGWGAVSFMARMPEPEMARLEGGRPPILKSLGAPFRDTNFRRLINFLFCWNFATQLAVPFFTVYMLVRLEMNLTYVVALGVLSQVTNVLFLKVWGPLVDQYGSKVVLSLCSSLYLLVILGWIFTTMPERHILTMPLLVFLHALLGIATAGINIASTTIRLKMAPQAQAMSYLTGASLAANLGAGLSPLLGGAFADYFSVRHFTVSLEWVSPSSSFDFPALNLQGYDFLFTVTFILGVITLNILTRLKEEGEADNETVMNELLSQTRDNLRAISTIPGVGLVSHFPHTLRYVPKFPGLDVAFGVTAYQLAASTKMAVEAVSRGNAAARDVRHAVNATVSRAVNEVEGAGKGTTEIARHATRGAMHAANTVGLGMGRLSHEAMRGTFSAFGRTRANPLDVIRGATYGIIQGASDVGADLVLVAGQAVDSARQAAAQLGLSEEQAVAQAAQVAIEAAEEMDGEGAAKVKDAMLRKLIASVLPKQGSPSPKDDSSEDDALKEPVGDL
ncbi:MAG: MFS transporter, partial [Acidobacteria bacterium]|nr:MFS transporter [Acidobacteriota bacterium]